MKIVDIAKKYGIEQKDFDSFLSETRQDYGVAPFTGEKTIRDDRVEMMVERYKEYLVEKPRIEEQKRLEAEAVAAEAARKKQVLANMLITSGFGFEGYRIVKYSGYISGDDAVQIDRGEVGFFSGTGATNVGEKLMQSLTVIRRNALRELKEAAYDLGCNAVIGVDFDYLTLDPQTATTTGGTVYQPYVFGVTANGNAVVIEKIEE